MKREEVIKREMKEISTEIAEKQEEIKEEVVPGAYYYDVEKVEQLKKEIEELKERDDKLENFPTRDKVEKELEDVNEEAREFEKGGIHFMTEEMEEIFNRKKDLKEIITIIDEIEDIESDLDDLEEEKKEYIGGYYIPKELLEEIEEKNKRLEELYAKLEEYAKGRKEKDNKEEYNKDKKYKEEENKKFEKPYAKEQKKDDKGEHNKDKKYKEEGKKTPIENSVNITNINISKDGIKYLITNSEGKEIEKNISYKSIIKYKSTGKNMSTIDVLANVADDIWNNERKFANMAGKPIMDVIKDINKYSKTPSKLDEYKEVMQNMITFDRSKVDYLKISNIIPKIFRRDWYSKMQEIGKDPVLPEISTIKNDQVGIFRKLFQNIKQKAMPSKEEVKKLESGGRQQPKLTQRQPIVQKVKTPQPLPEVSQQTTTTKEQKSR